jgi:branched-subunit amino acid transport protein
MEAGDLRGAFVALIAIVAMFFAGVLLKASADWFLWNSPAGAMGFWRWVFRYKLDDLAMLLLAGLVAYALLRYLEERVRVNAG